MKYVWIMRHATAENSTKDYDRKLTKIGEQEAIKAGKFLNKSDMLPELIIASNAARTRETALYIKQNIHKNVRLEFTEKLYRADAITILEQLRQIDEKYQAVMLIAHNPGVYEFSSKFLGTNPDLLKNTVPASIAYFTIDYNLWSLLENGQGNLRWFFVP